MKLLKETIKIVLIDSFIMFTIISISIQAILIVPGVLFCFYCDYLQLKDDKII